MNNIYHDFPRQHSESVEADFVAGREFGAGGFAPAAALLRLEDDSLADPDNLPEPPDFAEEIIEAGP